jgi:hypothetical protein
MERDEALKNCANCPHQSDCRQVVGTCLDDVNAQYLASHKNQFPRLMTPAQASRCTASLQEGWTLRRLYNGGNQGKPVVTPGKLKNHCAAYPEWGAEAMRLGKVNAKAADKLKGCNRSDQTIVSEVIR